MYKVVGIIEIEVDKYEIKIEDTQTRERSSIFVSKELSENIQLGEDFEWI